MAAIHSILHKIGRFRAHVALCISLCAATTPALSQMSFTGGPPGVQAVDMALTDSAIYVASLLGLYRSEDFGLNWSKLRDIPLHRSLQGTELPLQVKWTVKARHNKVLFAYYDDAGYHLLVSLDRGNSWTSRSYPVFNNQPVHWGQWEMTDSLILLQSGKRIFHSANNAASWSSNLMPLESETDLGMTTDGNQIYCWNRDSIFLSSDYFQTWEGAALPGIRSIKVKEGFLFGISAEGNGVTNFWMARSWGAPWEIKPNLQYLRQFEVAVTGDTILLWPTFNWESDRLWVADTVLAAFTRDAARRTPVIGEFSLFHTRLLHQSGRLFIYSRYRIFFAPYGHAFSYPSLWHSDNSGRRWTVRENTIEEPLINGLFPDGDRIWAATSSGLYYQIAGQNEWRPNDTIGPATFSVTRFGNRLWKTTLQTDSLEFIVLYNSDNDGNTWNADFGAANYPLVSTPEALYQYLGNVIYRRFHDENSWEDISDNVPGAFVSFPVLDVYYNGRIFTYSDQGALLSSTDAGEQWQPFPFPTFSYTPLRLLTVVDGSLVFVGGREYSSQQALAFQFEVYRWHDPSGAWMLLSNFTIPYTSAETNYHRKITGLVAHAGKWLLAIRGIGILESTNGGMNWNMVANDDVARNAVSIKVFDNSFYVASQFFGVWKIPGGTVAQREVFVKSGVRLFPNPNDGSILHLDAPYPLERLWVVDLNGRVVFESGPIYPPAALTLPEWKPGAYFVKMQNKQGNMEVRKILVVR
ncbi:MAG: T9SS type A sorting domain-containing protein [Saprospiraceae bacterium]|nr:T9SS type A sorting domain-containing protein [Saprospiraceae bacterium]